MLWNKYLFYTYIFISQRCCHVVKTFTKLSLSHTFHNVLGTLWARFVGHFDFFFVTLGHLFTGSGTSYQPVKVKWCGHHFLLCHFFSKACPDMIYADFPILQKGCHNIVNIVTLLRCRNEIMLWRCFLTTFCGSILATFLKLSWNMLQQLNLPTFSQFSPNVVETLLQPYIVSWDTLLYTLFNIAFPTALIVCTITAFSRHKCKFIISKLYAGKAIVHYQY